MFSYFSALNFKNTLLFNRRQALLIALIFIVFLFSLFLITNNTHAQSQTYCPGGDLDCNGKLEINDLKVLLSLYGSPTAQADLNRSGKVTSQDAAILIAKIFSLAGAPLTNTPPFPLYNAAKEKVPDFCTTGLVPGGGSIVTTTKSGNWSDPSVWSNGQVPNNIANGVQILAGHTITYDKAPAADVKISCIKVSDGGSFKFRTDIDTKLTVGTITDFGYMEVGKEINPVQTGKRAEIVIADQPLMINTTTPANSKDPNQLGNGLLVLKNGILRIHGEVKDADPNIYNTNSHAFIRLTAEPKAGQSTLSLSEDVTKYNWHVGDKIVLPDTRQITASQEGQFYYNWGQFPFYNEKITIASISANGQTITLATPLKGDHPGARYADGTLKFLPHVGNLTRNVYIHSQNPSGTRGHALFSERADVDIRYAEFDDMGRTKAATPVDNVAYDASNNVTKVGSNQIGRYTLHFHHDEGPVRTASQQTDPRVYQGMLIGNAIDENNGSKWGITLHDTSFTLVKNNTITSSLGANIMVEAGNEFKNVIEGNFLVDSQGPPTEKSGVLVAENRTNVLDFGFEGTGIWNASPFNYIRNNVAASSKHAGFEMYMDYGEIAPVRAKIMSPMIPSLNYKIPLPVGFLPFHTETGNYPQPTNWGVGVGTDYRGADMYNMTQTTNISIGQGQRLNEFFNNEAYGTSERAIHVIGGGPGVTLDTTRIWHTNNSGIQFTYTEGDGGTLENTANVIKNSTILGDVNALKNPALDNATNWDHDDHGPIGINLQATQYVNNELLDSNNIQGQKTGIITNGQYTRSINNYLKNYQNVLIFEGLPRFQMQHYFVNNDFNSIPNLNLNSQPPRDFYIIPSSPYILGGLGKTEFAQYWNMVTRPAFVRVFGYKSNGQALGDHRIYFLEQAPGFNVKQWNTELAQTTAPWNQWPNMTNQQLWSQYGNAVGDAIAPCNDTTTFSKIKGFTCPIDVSYQSYGTTAGWNRPKNATVMEDVYGHQYCNGVLVHLDQCIGTSVALAFRVNDGTQNGIVVTKTFNNLIMGANYLTVTDADVPTNQQSVLDLNKNSTIDQNEHFKKTFVVRRIQ